MEEQMHERRNRVVLGSLAVLCFSFALSALTLRPQIEYEPTGGVLGASAEIEFAYGKWDCKDGSGGVANNGCTLLSSYVTAASGRCEECTNDDCKLDRLKLRFHCIDGVSPCEVISESGTCLKETPPTPTIEPTITPSATLTPAATPTPEPTTTQAPANNLLTNPDFSSSKNNWSFNTKAQANFSVVNQEAKVVVTKTSGVIQLFQTGVELKPDTRYRVSFRGKSSKGNNATIQIIKHRSPYTNYVVGGGAQFELGTEWSDVSAEIQTTNFGATEPNARFRFWLGGEAQNGETYYFDDVVLEEL